MCEDGLYVWEWFGCVKPFPHIQTILTHTMCGNGLDV